jgi:hypothetical protein
MLANGGPGQVFAARGRDLVSDQLQEETDMFSMSGAGVIMTSPETEPEQLPADPGPAPSGLPAPTQREPLRPLAVAQCSLCGIALPLGLLVPDGGPGCADIRWYCKDAKSCTERWTTAGPPQHPHTPAVPGPATAPTEQLEGTQPAET